MSALFGMTADNAIAHVIATNPAFALTDTDIRGVSYRVFQNAPPHVSAMLYGSREPQGNGSFEYLVYGDGKELLVGIAWRSGNPVSGRRRSAELELWKPILAIPGVRFVNL